MFKDNDSTGGSGIFFGPVTQARTTDGGAIYLGPNCREVNIANSRFVGNSTIGNGGAIRSLTGADFLNCAFGGNTAGDLGGALDFYHDMGDPNTHDILSVTLKYCSFGGNRAQTGFYGWGGGARFLDVNAVVVHCDFTGNVAKNGAGLFVSGSTLSLTGSIVSGNRATGASMVDTTSTINLTGRFGFSRGIDTSVGTDAGGGLFLADTAATIADSTLSDNVAEGVNGAGGAIAFYGGYVPHVVRNCLITGNSSSKYGGGIACSAYATPKVQNCTFVKNTAGTLGGAIFCDWSADITITNSIFQKNNNRAIASADFDEKNEITHCLFHNNAQGDYGLWDSVSGQTSRVAGADLHSTNLAGDPLFASGPLGGFYLSQTASGQADNSPAVNEGDASAADSGFDTMTTRTDSGLDEGTVDIGYHYPDPATLAQYALTARVEGGHGGVAPASGTYYAGMFVPVTAAPDKGYRVAQWTGTANDASHVTGNAVAMWSDRAVIVAFDQPRTIRVSSDPNYKSIQHAIDEAVDGDVVVVPTGTYSPAWQGYPHPIINITKGITLTSGNPDDLEAGAATIVNYVVFQIATVGPEATIDGLTIQHSRMHIYGCSPTVRNCVFRECNWFGVDWPTNPTQPPDDGPNGGSVPGGAMMIINGSPFVENCQFDDCSVTGGLGGPGDNGVTGHEPGFDGGWGGYAYGGAVYCSFQSNPTFKDCRFTDCFALGGTGGRGGNGIQGARGGRGGSWEAAPSDETGPLTYPNWYEWDGWQYGLYDPTTGLPSFDTTIPYDTVFKDARRYSGYGGAVYCENESSPKFLNCTFENNRTFSGLSGVGGNPWETPNRPLDIENFGGALYACNGSNPELVNCTIRNCYADPNFDPNTLDPNQSLYSLPIPDDPYVGYGGALAFEDDCSVKLVDCTITGCEASVGGGVYWSKSKMEIADSRIEDNQAFHGGGLYSVESTGSVTASALNRNTAAYEDPGMQIVPDPNDPNIGIVVAPYDAGPIFGQGGGYCLPVLGRQDQRQLLRGQLCERLRRRHLLRRQRMNLAFAPQLLNSLMTGNTAGRDGGGVSAKWYAEPMISSCTITDNKVTGSRGDGAGFGGGLYASYGSNVTMIDSIVWGNFGVQGAQVAVGTGSDVVPERSSVAISYTDIGPQFDAKEIGSDRGHRAARRGESAGDASALRDAR